MLRGRTVPRGLGLGFFRRRAASRARSRGDADAAMAAARGVSPVHPSVGLVGFCSTPNHGENPHTFDLATIFDHFLVIKSRSSLISFVIKA